MKISLRLITFAGLILLAPLGVARADVIFNLSGVTFADGGTASGYFTTNDAITSLTGFDITTTPASVFTGTEYTYASAGSIEFSNSGTPVIDVYSSDSSIDLELKFTSILTSSGTDLIKLDGYSAENQEVDPYPYRNVTAGSVTPAAAVPEPGSLMLIAVAGLFAGAGIWWQDRKKATGTLATA